MDGSAAAEGILSVELGKVEEPEKTEVREAWAKAHMKAHPLITLKQLRTDIQKQFGKGIGTMSSWRIYRSVASRLTRRQLVKKSKALKEGSSSRLRGKSSKVKLPGRTRAATAKTSETISPSSENPLLKSWWDRTILPLLDSQGIRGIIWQKGGVLEIEVVTKLKL